MSNDDGVNRDDAFCNMSTPGELLHTAGGGGMSHHPTLLWQNQLGSAQFLHPQQHQQQTLYNMHVPYPGQQETYSVLPVGHGNFLKVYHCSDNAANNITNDGGMFHPQQQHRQQYQQSAPQTAFHLQQSQPSSHSSQIFNSYELFSSSTLMPTPDTQNNLESDTPHSQSQQPQLMFVKRNVHDDYSVEQAVNNSTNMIINKLVNNWSPNAGGTYMQFGSQVPPLSAQSSMSYEEENLPDVKYRERKNHNGFTVQLSQTHTEGTLRTTILPQLSAHKLQPTIESTPPFLNDTQSLNPAAAGTIGKVSVPIQTQNVNNISVNNSVPEIKKRIVAEVKPMRMTYSDVLSKLNNQHQQASNVPSFNAKQISNRLATSNVVASQGLTERKLEQKSQLDSTNSTVISKRHGNIDEGNVRPSKKSPLHEIKDNNSHQANPNNNNKSNKRANNNPINCNIQQKQVNKPPPPRPPNISGNCKKRLINKRNDVEPPPDVNKVPKRPPNESFYNVTAKHNDNYERSSKGGYQSSHSAVNTGSRKANKSSSGNYSNSSTSNANSSSFTNSGSQNRLRYNGNSMSSYSYSSKKSNRSSNVSSSITSMHNPNYELAKKILKTWLAYMLKVLNWLFYLVYDIIVLGFSVGYERLLLGFEYGFVYFQQWHRDLRQNSDKPGIWLKAYCRRFDARFKKNSLWAFWRRFYKKKPAEISTQSFKNGRLPQTGDEAMYSLLNCKGKDAYSILGVPPNSPQEQIRKHYKKIAVLVHPDKNKQAGAEEAFKVLQRAFELIGEPENRNAYDKSLAEALHAEKAWTELHDLLSQLQTKITEAANTIRCSTCSCRHPRKVTERPHYAARECASCKIRHSAREGDIWAETSFLGLRWKYLALMEGKVYDITEWANCQKGALSHLEPNSHMVQYRIIRGAQQQQQQQQHHQQQQQAHHHHSPHHRQQHAQGHNFHQDRSGSGKFKRDIPTSEASLHEFLDNLYSGQNPSQSNTSAASSSFRRRARRN